MQQWDQTAFDELFISTTEICKYLNVDRVTVHHAKVRGDLPEPIRCVNSDIWVRADIKDFLSKWKVSLNKRRKIDTVN